VSFQSNDRSHPSVQPGDFSFVWLDDQSEAGLKRWHYVVAIDLHPFCFPWDGPTDIHDVIISSAVVGFANWLPARF